MQFFNVEKLFDFILICLFSWKSLCCVLCLMRLVNEHLCLWMWRVRGKICLTFFWHMWIDDTVKRTDKKSIDLFSIELDEASKTKTRRESEREREREKQKKCVFCLLLLFSKSQYWSKDYWLGVNCALLLLPSSFFFLMLFNLRHSSTPTIQYMLKNDFISSKLLCNSNNTY